METVFMLGNLLVLPWWLLMIALPVWRWTPRIIGSPLIAGPPALLYAALVLPQLAMLFPAVVNPRLAEIAALLGSPSGATIAWLHFLAFDLLIGRWVYLDSRERGVSLWLISPILFLVLMFGPLGFLLYLALRAVGSRRDDRATATSTATSA